MHGLKGCFLMLGWMRLARRCIEVLDLARKGEFTGWEAFPTELEKLFDRSTAGMIDYLAAINRLGGSAERTAVVAEAGRTAVRPAPDAKIPVDGLVESDSGEDGVNAGAGSRKLNPARQ